MKLLTRLILIVACFTAAFTIGTVTQAAPAAATVTAASSHVAASTEAHACHEAVVFSRAVRADQLTSGPAWHHAWDASGHADPDLERAIRHYLDSGHGWPQVMYLCGYGL